MKTAKRIWQNNKVIAIATIALWSILIYSNYFSMFGNGIYVLLFVAIIATIGTVLIIYNDTKLNKEIIDYVNSFSKEELQEKFTSLDLHIEYQQERIRKLQIDRENLQRAINEK